MAAPSSPLDRSKLARLAQVRAVDRLDVEIAEGLVADYLGRHLWLPGNDDDPWTDELEVWAVEPRPGMSGGPFPDPLDGGPGVVYPRGCPVVSIPDDGNDFVAVRRDSVSIAVAAPVGALVQVTYRGGWTATDCPFPVQRAIALLAAALRPPRPGTAGPAQSATSTLVEQVRELAAAGVTSAKLGDVSVSIDRTAVSGTGGAGGAAQVLEDLVPGIVRSLRGWRRRDL